MSETTVKNNKIIEKILQDKWKTMSGTYDFLSFPLTAHSNHNHSDIVVQNLGHKIDILLDDAELHYDYCTINYLNKFVKIIDQLNNMPYSAERRDALEKFMIDDVGSFKLVSPNSPLYSIRKQAVDIAEHYNKAFLSRYDAETFIYLERFHYIKEQLENYPYNEINRKALESMIQEEATYLTRNNAHPAYESRVACTRLVQSYTQNFFSIHHPNESIFDEAFFRVQLKLSDDLFDSRTLHEFHDLLTTQSERLSISSNSSQEKSYQKWLSETYDPELLDFKRCLNHAEERLKNNPDNILAHTALDMLSEFRVPKLILDPSMPNYEIRLREISKLNLIYEQLQYHEIQIKDRGHIVIELKNDDLLKTNTVKLTPTDHLKRIDREWDGSKIAVEENESIHHNPIDIEKNIFTLLDNIIKSKDLQQSLSQSTDSSDFVLQAQTSLNKSMDQLKKIHTQHPDLIQKCVLQYPELHSILPSEFLVKKSALETARLNTIKPVVPLNFSSPDLSPWAQGNKMLPGESRNFFLEIGKIIRKK